MEVGDYTTQLERKEPDRCKNCGVVESKHERLFQKEGARKDDPLYCERCLLKMEGESEEIN